MRNIDHAGRVTRQQTQTGSTAISSSYTYGNAQQGIPAVHLNGIVHSVNNTPLWSYSIARTLLGQVSSQSGTGALANQSEFENFGYDTRGRLTADAAHYQTSSSSVSDKSSAYSWDLANNLQGGAGGWNYNNNNQATSAAFSSGAPSLSGASGLAYDGAGHLSGMNGATLSWDCWGHLVGASGTGQPTVTYTYDSAGHRVSKTVNGVTTFYLYAGAMLLAELDSSGAITRSYNWGPLGLISDSSSAGSRFYLFDGIGNTRFLLNAAGQVVSDGAYTAWGALNSASYPSTPFCWKGQWGAFRDSETGLLLMGARYYAPAIGRFISRDPSGFASGLNLYAFCTGDPVNFFDPDGREAEEDEGPFWNFIQGAADGANSVNQPLQLIIPSPNPFATLMGAHDAFRDWGEAEGNTKSSPEKLLRMRANAALHFGLAAFEFTGYGLAATRGLSAFLRGGCFIAGTPVQTVVKGANGRFHVVVKPIERIRKGDLVLARNEKTGKTQMRRVLKTTVRDVDKVLTVALADAKTHRVVERITATREHPFYVEHKGFVPAGGLAVGNAIVTRAGPALIVESIKWNRRADGYKVYNLAVEDDHTYFVGAYNGGVWVHNQTIYSWDIWFSRPPRGYEELFTNGPWEGRSVGEAIQEAQALGRLPEGLELNAAYHISGGRERLVAINNRTLYVAQEANLFVKPTIPGNGGVLLGKQFTWNAKKGGSGEPIDPDVVRGLDVCP